MSGEVPSIKRIENHSHGSIRLSHAPSRTDVAVPPFEQRAVDVPIAACEDAASFLAGHVAIQVESTRGTLCLWLANGKVRASHDGQWSPDAKPVLGDSSPDHDKRVLVGGTGSLTLRKSI